jgi:hypothetical protein
MKRYCLDRDEPQKTQASQSAATVAFRALVMLGFIIGVPLIAFNGSSLPEQAKKMLDKVWPAITSAISAKTADLLAEAPRFDAKTQNSQPPQTLSVIANPVAQAGANNQPDLLYRSAPENGNAQSARQAPNILPVDYQTAIEPINNQGQGGLQAATNPFMAMQDRLRQLGATYYLLETWGNQRQLFRFYCQMAVGGNSNYTHYFEAINANPLQAMSDVLRQVEDWRGGGDPLR